jgi:hypothetical protein
MPLRRPCNRRLPLEGKIAPSRHTLLLATFVRAAFGGIREREKAGWTNDLHYPIRVKISRRKGLSEGEKGLRSKDLRGAIVG